MTGASPGATSSSLTPGTGPAGPVLTISEWAHVEALCIANANTDNSSIRAKIAAYFTVRHLHSTAGGQQQDPILTACPPPARGAQTLPSRSAGSWHYHPYRQAPDPDKVSHDACTICGYPRSAVWHHQAPAAAAA